MRRKSHPRHLITLICLILFGSNILIAQNSGYWKLEKIETTLKDFSAGKLNKQVSGNPGNLTYTDDNGNTGSKFIVSGIWSTPPEEIAPGNLLRLTSQLKIDKFLPPKHHYKPVVDLYIQTYRLTNSFENRKRASTWYHANVSGNTKEQDKKVVIDHTTDVEVPSIDNQTENLFIVGVKLGSTSANKEVFYIYKWTKGEKKGPDNEIVSDKKAWKLIDIVPEKKEKISGENIKRYVTGDIGSLTYINEFGANGMYGIRAKTRWDKLPEVLFPGHTVTIGYQCEVIEYNPPAHKWQPDVKFYFHDYKPTNSVDEKKLNSKLGIMQININSREPDHLFKGNDFAIINPPVPNVNQPSYYVVRIKFGSTDGSMTYYYVYEWQE